MRKLTIVFFDAGAGHRNAANAIAAVLERGGHPWDVSLMNMQELMDGIDPVLKLTKIRIQDAYNEILRRGWTGATPYLLPILHAAVRAYHPFVVKALIKYWHQNPTD